MWLFLSSNSRDAVTNLRDLAAFDAEFSQSFRIAKRTHSPLSLIMLDIDHFGRVNDKYGPPDLLEVCNRQILIMPGMTQ